MPDDSTISPPDPLSPDPTLTYTEPPRPELAVPDPINREPLLPDVAMPVLSTNTPLTPAVPAFTVCIRSAPLDVNDPYPLDMDT